MKILFGEKYFGKDTSEVPSGFLVWCIEEYKSADWTLIDACKTELATRLKLDWVPAPRPFTQEETIIAFRRHVYDRLHKIGWTEERIIEAGGKEVNWTPPKENMDMVSVVMRSLDRIHALTSERDLLINICKLFGLQKWDVEKYYFSPELLTEDLRHAELGNYVHIPTSLTL